MNEWRFLVIVYNMYDITVLISDPLNKFTSFKMKVFTILLLNLLSVRL